MANTINAYDADVRIPQFLGLKQYGDLMNGNPVYADHALNVNTKGGTLMPMAKPSLLYIEDESGEMTYPIETLMCVSRRQYRDQILVAAANGRLYYYQDNLWKLATMPEGLDGFTDNTWSWVDYEYTPLDSGDGTPHDVILFSNQDNGMFMLDSVDFTISAVPTPEMFGIIERTNERIWGAAIKDKPDWLYYSATYDPTDWCHRDPSYEDDPEEFKKNGQPEDGAGEIVQPSWDGDAFTTLRAFGDQLIAFKRTRVWRVVGTNPGEYVFKEQYGGGAMAAHTVAVDANRIYMLGRDGVYAYDGNSVEPFGKEYAWQVFDRMNVERLDEACGCVWRDKYYLAIPIDGSAVNNAVVTYDLHDGTWLLRTDLKVESWLPAETALYFTTSDEPYNVHQYHEDAWVSGEAIDENQEWVMPWNDLSFPQKNKGPFAVYFSPEVQDRPVDFTLTIDTEKSIKSKTVTIYPDMGYEKRMNREAKVVRVPFAINGRRFRMRLLAKGGAVWRICGGILIHLDQETED